MYVNIEIVSLASALSCWKILCYVVNYWVHFEWNREIGKGL